MSKFFKSQAGAALVTVLVMAVSTLTSGTVGLNAEAQEVQGAFYSGVYSSEDGYWRKSISSQLDIRAAAANGICSIANKFPELDAQSKALAAARNLLLDSQTISGKYKANLAMHEAYNALSAVLSGVDTSADQKALDSYIGNFEGAQRVIDGAGYNEFVREFTRTTYDAFPADLIAELTGVKAPELFS